MYRCAKRMRAPRPACALVYVFSAFILPQTIVQKAAGCLRTLAQRIWLGRIVRWLPLAVQRIVLDQQHHTVRNADEREAELDRVSRDNAHILHGKDHRLHAHHSHSGIAGFHFQPGLVYQEQCTSTTSAHIAVGRAGQADAFSASKKNWEE